MTTEGNRFPHSLAFRLDGATFEKLCDAASARGVKPAALVREYVIDLLGSAMKAPRYRRIPHAELLREALVELRRQGSNLNQLAKAANMSDDTMIATDVAVIRSQLDALSSLVLDALGVETTV
ncbi:plasmid mobilization relaxosome protein MobC [Bosea sp. PAMC 26642]|uniref:plasmid mobilization relaxosome protein MobC n=1 Tax=Bosea sp. (strain PAMC 26642) TaxID=1792307 RepID=UPI0007705962|nr:plasmid mobilization relaxosome protein MobC [Bosea sp. PAMC 26642]AMJ61597.1 hypothetical protein AXW83_15935 [Bosea sp. PAMC 26642]